MENHTASFALRNIGQYSILIGTFSHSPNELEPCPVMHASTCHLTGDSDTLSLSFSTTLTPIDEHTKQDSLTSMCTEHDWQGCNPLDTLSIAGGALFVDTFLLSSEQKESISRKTFLVVLQNHEHAITLHEHAIYQGSAVIDPQKPANISFSMTRDTQFDTNSFRGESLTGLLSRTPCTTFDGLVFFNHNIQEKLTCEMITKAVTEIADTGALKNDTVLALKEYRLTHYYKNEDYNNYICNIAKREPLYLKKLTHLLTQEETEQLKNASIAFLHEEMNV